MSSKPKRGDVLDPKVAVEIRQATIGYSSKEPLLSSINIQFYKGEIVAIAGPSGIGKTTLLRTIAGLVPPLDGNFFIDGKENKPSRGELGYIPQRLGLVRHASVYHNVLLGALAGHTSPWFPYSSAAKKVALEAISSVGLDDKIRTPIRRLSGGQQRRVATARTLAQRPSLILADEFLGELDDETMNLVMDKVTSYVRESNATLIVIEHDISRAKEMADRILIMDDGRLNPFVNEPIAIELSKEFDKEVKN